MFLVFRKKIMKNAFAGFDKPRRTRRMHYKLAHGSEFQISAQFDSAGATIRQVIGVQRSTVGPKVRTLNCIKSIVGAATCWRCSEGRMVKCIQHFRLQAETKPLRKYEVFRDRDI